MTDPNPTASGFLDRVFDNLALEYAARGEGTGAWSKILSGISFPLFGALAATLVIDGHYVALAAIAAMFISQIAVLVVVGLIAYLIYVQSWAAASLLIAYAGLSIASLTIGRRNAKRLLMEGSPMISPFEAMPEILVFLFAEPLLLFLSLVTSGYPAAICWALFGLVIVFHAGRFLYRLYPRWSRVHHPLMVRYACAAGMEAAKATAEGREFSFHDATVNLLQLVYPKKSEEDIDRWVCDLQGRMAEYEDAMGIERELRKCNPTVKEDTLKSLRDKAAKFFVEGSDNALLTRYAIAEVVGELHGSEERARYLMAVIMGDAR